MDGIRILGIGLGVIILIVIWILAFLICCFVSHINGNSLSVGIIVISFAGTITVILFSIPRSPEIPVDHVKVPIVDEYIIYRIILVLVMGLTFLAGLVLMVTTHWSKPIQARPMTKTKII